MKAQVIPVNGRLRSCPRQIALFNQQKTELQGRADEQIALRLDPVIKEGQRLEASLQERMGQAATKAVVFESANVTIVETGLTINASHIAKIQRTVKEHLDEMEIEGREQLRRDQEQLAMEVARVRAEADEGMDPELCLRWSCIWLQIIRRVSREPR